MSSTTLTVRINAGLAVLASIVTVVVGAFLAASAIVDAPAGGSSSTMTAVAILLAVLSAWGIATGVCIFLRQGWARVSMVIFAGMLIPIGVAACVYAIVKPAGTARIDWATGVLGVALAGVGIWWLGLFKSRSVQNYFAESVHLDQVQ